MIAPTRRARTVPTRFRIALLVAVLALLAGSVEGALAKSLPGAAGCPMFPASNIWNRRVDSLPVRSDSDTLVASIGLGNGLHPDFGSYSGYGIPYNVANHMTPKKTVTFRWKSESDKGPYPIPKTVKREAGSDHHVLVVDKDACKLYELFAASKSSSGKWSAGSGAIWNLRLNRLRPDGWTSADAAGLPILPGLVRYPEVAAGVIDHALRFTAPQTRDAHIYPARHDAGSGSSASLPPMGLRVRLKASFDLSQLSPQARVVAVALQHYGMILADNGSPWYVSGVSNKQFSDDDLRTLNRITGRDLEVVDTSGLVNTP